MNIDMKYDQEAMINNFQVAEKAGHLILMVIYLLVGVLQSDVYKRLYSERKNSICT